MISIGDDEQAHASIGKLISALDEQEERAKNAKEIKPTKPATAAAAASPAAKKTTKGRQVGASTMPESEILTDPDRALARQEQELGDPLNARIEGVYERIISILTQANRGAEAQRFSAKLNGIKSRLH
jgi:hypothetical protein